MSDDALEERLADKIAHYEHQELSDKDDEQNPPDEVFERISQAFADSEAMPPPKLVRSSSSFLGLPPKEQHKALRIQLAKTAPILKSQTSELVRATMAPDLSIGNSFPATKWRQSPASSPRHVQREGMKRTASLPDMTAQKDIIPFYRRAGAVPRELKRGKNVKLADKIKLEPEDRQILKGKVVYFYPNDDISMPRRQRLHKLIQLGAAWVKTWRDDVTHILLDDNDRSYPQILHHLNKAGLPRHIVLAKFDPYIPQCIQYGMLLDPTASRFLVKGAPTLGVTATLVEAFQPAEPPEPPQVKPSQRQIAAHQSQKQNSALQKDSSHDVAPDPEEHLSSTEDIVEDSFIYESSFKPQDHHNDALFKAIQETKAIAHLPLDEEEEEESTITGSDNEDCDSSTDGDNSSPPPFKRRKIHSNSPNKGKAQIPQNAFQCMEPLGTKPSQNPNSRIIEILDQMCKYYDQMQDQWRTLAYRKAITTLRKHTSKISTSKEALALPFIGQRLADKIEEIVLTDHLRRLDTTRNDPTDQVFRLFLGIYGVGLSQASRWINAGYRTLDDLDTKAKLTDSQKIGIERYDDFAQRIPRAEVEAHGNYVKAQLRRLDPQFEATIMGSYRRGATDSGDIDIIISKPGASNSQLRDVVFGTLIPALTQTGFLVYKLATSSRTDGGSKWHGCSCLPGSKTWRRMDLLLVPDYEMGAALLYFTGNDIFNRSIRLLASQKGMRLNQRGLYKDVVRGRNREKLNEGMLVEGRSERRIFELLGVPWREPTERIC